MLPLSTSAAERRAPELSCNGAGQRFIYLIQLVYQLPDKSLMSSGTTGGSRACARKRSPLVFPSEGFFFFFPLPHVAPRLQRRLFLFIVRFANKTARVRLAHKSGWARGLGIDFKKPRRNNVNSHRRRIYGPSESDFFTPFAPRK